MALDISEMLNPEWAEKWAERFKQHADNLDKEAGSRTDGKVTDIRKGQAAKFRHAATLFQADADKLRGR